jgi:hypothetical protein
MPRVKVVPAAPDREMPDVEIARLRDLDLSSLRARWQTVFGRRPASPLPRPLLFRMPAFRLQADHLGDLDPEIRRLLEVPLSFAQFEREVTSERIRDKIAASKRKGLWVGGKVPLGYMAKDRKITVVEEEAERVRTIFRSYLELGSLDRVMGDLHRRGILTKIQALKTGRTIGGIAFTRGPLSYLLRNRFYVGEVVYKGEILRGEQPAIIDRDLFEAVQARLAEQQNNHNRLRANSEAVLVGRIFDDAGHPMSPSHARKRGVRYRYYVSLPLIQGQSERTGSICRIPALEVERVIADAVRRELKAGLAAEWVVVSRGLELHTRRAVTSNPSPI